jgi:hypothetical protein
MKALWWMRLVALLPVLMLLPRNAPAADDFDKVDPVVGSFLKIEPDPRGEALGGAYSALTRGASSVYWNPAGLAFVSGIEIADQGIVVSEIEWLAGLRLSFGAVAMNLGDPVGNPRLGTICVWRSRLESGPIAETTEYPQDGTGYWSSARDEAVGFSYAHRVTEALGLGVTFKDLDTDLASYDASGQGFDIGAAFHDIVRLPKETELELAGAAGVRNLGSAEFGTGRSTDLPRQGYIGLAPTFRAVPMQDWLFEISVAGELMYDDPRDKWTAMGGVEIVLMDAIATRFGKHNAEASARGDSWGYGASLRYGHIAGLAFDYARTDMDRLDDVERFMLTVRLLKVDQGFDLRALME